MVHTRASSITQAKGRDIAAKAGATGADTGATDVNTDATGGNTEGGEADQDDEAGEEKETTTLPGASTTTVDIDALDTGFQIDRIRAGAPRGASLGFILQTMLAGFGIVQAASMAQ